LAAASFCVHGQVAALDVEVAEVFSFGRKRILRVMDLASLLNERRHLHQVRSAILAATFFRARSLFCCGRT